MLARHTEPIAREDYFDCVETVRRNRNYLSISIYLPLGTLPPYCSPLTSHPCPHQVRQTVLLVPGDNYNGPRRPPMVKEVREHGQSAPPPLAVPSSAPAAS